MPRTERYKDATLDPWDLKSEPVAILGSTVGHGPKFTPDETPAIGIEPGVACRRRGCPSTACRTSMAIWQAPVAKVDDPKVDMDTSSSRATTT